MSKRITTRWYIGAWVVWVIALVVTLILRNSAHGAFPPGAFIFGIIIAITGVIALVMWIGALVKLASQTAWGWFIAVLILQLIGLGIIGMVAYAVAGPEDMAGVAIRPTTT